MATLYDLIKITQSFDDRLKEEGIESTNCIELRYKQGKYKADVTIYSEDGEDDE